MELVDESKKMESLKSNARMYFEKELNWKTAGIKIKEVIEKSIQTQHKNIRQEIIP